VYVAPPSWKYQRSFPWTQRLPKILGLEWRRFTRKSQRIVKWR